MTHNDSTTAAAATYFDAWLAGRAEMAAVTTLRSAK
jgi:hypothetical protein